MKFPERIIIEFEPIDDGSMFRLDIEAKYETDRDVIAEMIKLAYDELTESLARDSEK